MTDISERVEYLKKIHLFHGMTEDELNIIAQKLIDYSVNEGEVIFQQGDKAENFYFILKGKVRITRKTNEKVGQLAVLVSRDYFGEMALVSNRRRSATVTALMDTSFLRLERKDFAELYKTYPKLKPNLDVTIRSRSLARSLHFNWIRSDEVVYFLARKHWVILLEKLALPVLAVPVPFVIFYVWWFVWPSFIAGLTSLISFIAIILWLAWVVIDWGNDYYIVTNQRVVWLEKVIGIYDSRMESPLSTILSVGVETDQLGRILDYGNVIVRTFVGKIPFSHVNHPNQASRMIEEYWERTKDFAGVAEKEAMKNAIRKKLGIPLPARPAPVSEKTAVPPLKPSPLRRFLGEHRLKMRYEQGDTVIYRKHWVVLIQQVWMPALGILAVIGTGIWHAINLYRSVEHAFIQTLPDGKVNVDILGGALLLLLVPFIGWFIYQFIDWSNDIFEVTNEQVVDIDKKPLSKEERKAAPLENILSTEYERIGIIANIFNYGTVYITVGGTKLAFEDVIYPAMVQSDIDRRRMARKTRQEEGRAAADRERLADWIAMYHTNSETFRKEQEQNKNKPKSE